MKTMSEVLKLMLSNFEKLEEFESLLKQPVYDYYKMVDETHRPLKSCVSLDIVWPVETAKRWTVIHNFAMYVYSEHRFVCQELLKITQDTDLIVSVIGNYSVHERLLDGFTGPCIVRAIAGELTNA